MNELVAAFEKYLNGVERSSIESLIDRYDVNGDGRISFGEFFELLVRRDASKASHPRSDPRSNHGSLLKEDRVRSPAIAEVARPQHGRHVGKPSHARRHRDEPDLDSTSVDDYNEPSSSWGRRGAGALFHEPEGGRGGQPEQVSHGQQQPRPRDPQHTGTFGVTYGGRAAGRAEPRPGGRKLRPDRPPPQRESSLAAAKPPRSSTDNYSEVSSVSDISVADSEASSECSEYSTLASEMSSRFDPDDAGDMESRVRVFMHNLRAYLVRTALQMRKEDRVADNIHMHTQTMVERVGRDMLLRAFRRASQSMGRDEVNFRSFCK